MNMSPEFLSELAAEFPKGGRRHHAKLIRTLATELLKARFEATMLRAMVDGIQEQTLKARQVVPFVAPCDEDAA